MNIRPAIPEDAATISNLIHSLTHHITIHPEGVGAEDFFKTISPEAIEGLIIAPNFLYLAGFIKDELAGVIAMRDNQHLYHLFVSPAFQRKGVAKELWKTMIDKSRSQGNPGEFKVKSTPFAVPVYQSFGFEVVGKRVETKGVAFIPMKLSQASNVD